MYMVMIAARMRRGSLAREASKASAAPWKRVIKLGGRPIFFSTSRMAVTASPKEARGARLKEMVAAGNWARWLICSGARRSVTAAMAKSGTWPPTLVDEGKKIEENAAIVFCRAGSASRMTRYWLDWVKMVEMMRWPNASYSALSI